MHFRETVMNARMEGTLAVVAALFVLVSAMISPPVSAGLAVVFLLGLAGYKILKKA
jgi:hypothetical protein